MKSPKVQRSTQPQKTAKTDRFTPSPVVQTKQEGTPDSELPQWKPSTENYESTSLSGLYGHSTPVQAKLTIGEVGDKYEQEADQVAKGVVEQINSPAAQNQSVQRETEEDELQRNSILQRQEALGGGAASPGLESTINQAKGGGQPLEAGLQQQMGQVMGADFSGVKVHTNNQADQLNESIQAKAFTTGQDIFFKQGEYQPKNKAGQELIAHELTHVVQQNVTSTQVPNISSIPNVQKKVDILLQRKIFHATVNQDNAPTYRGGIEIGKIKKQGTIIGVDDNDVPVGMQKVKNNQIRDIVKIDSHDVQDPEKHEYKKEVIQKGQLNSEDVWISTTKLKDHKMYQGIEGKSPEKVKIAKLKEIAHFLQPYLAIHAKYKAYKKQLSSTTSNILNTVADCIKTILKVIEKVDPTGIVAVIRQVLGQIKKIFNVIEEINTLKDTNTREELTPLLAGDLSFNLNYIKEQIQRIWDSDLLGEDIEEQVIVMEDEDEQVIITD